MYGKVDLLKFVEEMGKSFAESGLFGCDTIAQGKVLALHCITANKDPVAVAQRYHIMKSNLSLTTDAMLADFRTVLGGHHKILERTSDAAEIELSLNGEKERFRLTWEECSAEPFPWVGKESDIVAKLQNPAAGDLQLKAKYATPRSRMQMLWARIVSDSVRAMAPEICTGIYPPEVTSDVVGDDTLPEEEVCGIGEVAGPKSLPTTAADPPAELPGTKVEPEKSSGLSTGTAQELMDQFQRTGATQEDRETILAKRGATAIMHLTEEQARELIEKLKGVVSKSEPEKSAEPQQKDFQQSLDGPITPELVLQCKQLIAEASQDDKTVIHKVKDKLRALGKERIDELSLADGEVLRAAFETKALEKFFELKRTDDHTIPF